MLTNALLAFGLVFTTATQMRIPGLPLGIGEACLFLWLGLMLLRQLLGGHVFNRQALLLIGLFWALFTLALSLGTVVGLLSNFVDFSGMLHDAEAYVLMATFCYAIVSTMEADRALSRTLWLLLTFWNVALALQIAAGWGLIALPSVDPWYWDRFRGWSENPNQPALICAVFTPLSLHVALSSNGLGRVAGFSSCLLTVILGRLTKSDTFLVATAAATALFMILQVRSWLSSPEHRHSLRFALALLVVTAIVPLSLASTPLIMGADIGGAALSLTKDKGGEGTKETTNLRLYLWGEAMRTGLETGSLGLGPGAHLERPMGPIRVLPAPYESHSTIFESFIQGGLLAVIAICGLFAGTFLLTLRKRLDGLAVLTASIVIFSISHVVLRQPIVWFALVLSLILGTRQTYTAHQ